MGEPFADKHAPAALQAGGAVPDTSLRLQAQRSLVVAHATTREMQERSVAALIAKTEILWHLLDCVESACQRAVKSSP